MKEKLKKIFKNKIFIMVVLSISFFMIGAKAAQVYYANEISYTPTDTSWKVVNVSDALNSLYSMKTELANLKSIGTATASDILSGKTALVGGTTITGSMTNRGTLNWNPSSSTSYTIPSGYYSGGTISTSNAYNAGVSNGYKLYTSDQFEVGWYIPTVTIDTKVNNIAYAYFKLNIIEWCTNPVSWLSANVSISISGSNVTVNATAKSAYRLHGQLIVLYK